MFLLNTKEIVKKILLTPIECNKRYKTIKLVNGEICSPQKYYCGEDCDMSDFAVGFYEIIYANIIPGKKILNNGFFTSKEFAGDTMNSFNSLANIILDNNDKNSRSSKDIWPDYLEKYEKDYHCLANFWVIPMRHGRKSAKLGRYDSLDYYLQRLEDDYESFKHDEAIKYTRDDNLYTNYFKIIDTFDKFLEAHCISNYKIIKNTQEIYKNRDKEKCKKLIENIYSSMEERAEIISKKYTNELYQYFSRLGLI